MGGLKILSLNCRGLNGMKKRKEVFQFLKENKSDIYCLQDTHFTMEMQKTVYAEWNSECYFSHGTSKSRGVAVLFGNNIECKINNTLFP